MKRLFKKCERGGPISDSALVSYYWTATQTAIITYITTAHLGDPAVTEIQNTQRGSEKGNTNQNMKESQQQKLVRLSLLRPEKD